MAKDLGKTKCKWCGHEFKKRRLAQKYCCESHKQLAYHKRRKEIYQNRRGQDQDEKD